MKKIILLLFVALFLRADELKMEFKNGYISNDEEIAYVEQNLAKY